MAAGVGERRNYHREGVGERRNHHPEEAEAGERRNHHQEEEGVVVVAESVLRAAGAEIHPAAVADPPRGGTGSDRSRRLLRIAASTGGLMARPMTRGSSTT